MARHFLNNLHLMDKYSAKNISYSPTANEIQVIPICPGIICFQLQHWYNVNVIFQKGIE